MDNRGYFSGGGVGEVYYGFEIRWKPADDPQEEVLEVGEVRVFREVAPLRAWFKALDVVAGGTRRGGVA
jgi:hypothetical protein